MYYLQVQEKRGASIRIQDAPYSDKGKAELAAQALTEKLEEGGSVIVLEAMPVASYAKEDGKTVDTSQEA